MTSRISDAALRALGYAPSAEATAAWAATSGEFSAGRAAFGAMRLLDTVRAHGLALREGPVAVGDVIGPDAAPWRFANAPHERLILLARPDEPAPEFEAARLVDAAALSPLRRFVAARAELSPRVVLLSFSPQGWAEVGPVAARIEAGSV